MTTIMVFRNSWAQIDFRGRNDDGSETAATWKAAVNTNWSQDVSEIFRVRFEIKVSIAVGSVNTNFKLKYSHNGGAYTNMAAQGATTAPIRYADSSNVADGDSTTEQLNGPNSFQAGFITEITPTGSRNFSGTEDVEHEFVLEIYAPQVSDGDTIKLRVYRNNNSALSPYTNTPTITVVKASGSPWHHYRQLGGAN